MNEEAFVNRRAAGWERFNVLTKRASGGFRALAGPELIEYVRLYRQASADLAYLATHASNSELVDYLNALVGTAYGQLYRAPAVRLPVLIVSGIRRAATTFRRRILYVAASAGTFAAGALVAVTLLQAAPDLREHVIPPGISPLFEQWKTGSLPEREAGDDIMMTAMYASNNPVVALMSGSIAAGTFGVGTIMLLWSNGGLLGSLASEMASVGHLDFLLASILPHGVTEIGGLLIAAAGGLCMGVALIAPGRKSRGEALKYAGKDAFTLMLTGITMMYIAAPIEGFFSFNPNIPEWLKWMVALATFVGWSFFYSGFGKDEDALSEQPANP